VKFLKSHIQYYGMMSLLKNTCGHNTACFPMQQDCERVQTCILLSTFWFNTMHLFIDLSISYAVKLNSNMFWWQTPPPSGKTPQTKNTNVRKCLSYHAHITIFYVPPATESCLCQTSHVCTGVVGCSIRSEGPVKGCIHLC
jgi:hypothetical protein